jgi:DDE_Tnp_1-associated
VPAEASSPTPAALAQTHLRRAPPRRRPSPPACLPGHRPRPPSCPWPPHPLVAILGLAAAAVLAGARSIAAIAEWAADAPQPIRVALGARRDAPGHCTVPAEATIRRTLTCLDADVLAAAIGAWLAGRDPDRYPRQSPHGRRSVAVDGKTLRGARAPTPGGDGHHRPVHLLACMDHATRAVLAQRQIGGAPEEVPAFVPLLADLDLTRAVVTADALQTHPEAAEFLVRHKQAHYCSSSRPTSPCCWTAARACRGITCPWPTAPTTAGTAASSCAPSKRSRSTDSASRTPPRSSRSPARPATCTPTGGGP